MGDAAGITRNGLKVDQAKAAEWRRRSAVRYAAKQRARRQAARLTSSIGKPPARTRNDWPPKVRRMAAQRSGGVCELCQSEPACHLHHRKPRRFRDHRIVNALHLCAECHDRVGRNPSWSYPRGYLLRANQDPAVVPVHVGLQRPFLLTESGTYREAA